MERNFAPALPLVLRHEGGYSNHPKDPGGATMKGVTLATFRRYKPGATVADLKAISTEMLARIYRDGYWDKVRGDDLPAGVDYTVFDFAVNSGPGRAVKYLQGASGVPQDGQIGPVTLAAVAKQNPVSLINSICDARLAFLRRLDTWPTFRKGWSSRVAGVRKEALRMAEVTTPNPSVSKPFNPKTDDLVTTPPALPIEPVVVHVNEDGTVKPGEAPEQPNTDNLFWRLLWAALDLIFGRKKP